MNGEPFADRSGHCARWARHLPHRDRQGMPGLGAALDDWFLWYSSCACRGCSSVAEELIRAAGPPTYVDSATKTVRIGYPDAD